MPASPTFPERFSFSPLMSRPFACFSSRSSWSVRLFLESSVHPPWELVLIFLSTDCWSSVVVPWLPWSELRRCLRLIVPCSVVCQVPSAYLVRHGYEACSRPTLPGVPECSRSSLRSDLPCCPGLLGMSPPCRSTSQFRECRLPSVLTRAALVSPMLLFNGFSQC